MDRWLDGGPGLAEVDVPQNSLRFNYDNMHHLADFLLILLEYLLIEFLDRHFQGLILVRHLLVPEVPISEPPGVLLHLHLIVSLEISDLLLNDVSEFLSFVDKDERLRLINLAKPHQHVVLNSLRHDSHDGLAKLDGLIADLLHGQLFEFAHQLFVD